MLLACAALFGYGAVTDLTTKIDLRVNGVKVAGTIIDYESHFTGEYPKVSYLTNQGERLTVRAAEKFFPWVAPPVNSTVAVCYDPLHSTRFHLLLTEGLAQFAWLELPAALAFMCTFLLATGLRFLLY